MAEYSVFDKLVTRLSSSERRDMLQRIAAVVQTPPMQSEYAVEEESVDLDAVYGRMGLFRRLVVALVAAFTGRDRLSVVETQLLRDVRRRTATRTPDYDATREQLRPSALQSFRALAEAARHFSGPLSRVMGRERGPFVAFLAGLHAPPIQQRLMVDADPFAVFEKAPELSLSDIKRRAVMAMEETLVTLPSDIRQLIYRDVRTLHHLMTLSSFPFERLLAEFTPGAEGDVVPVPLSRLADELGRLSSILGGLQLGPSALLLQAISLYQEQDRLEEPDERVEGLLQRDMQAASEAYGVIAEFAARYPVADLVRLALMNIHWRAVPLSGGEDWFAVWKNFWKERIETLHRKFSYERQLETLLADARRSLGVAEIRVLPGYPSSGLDKPARHGVSLGVAHALVADLYPKELKDPLTVLYRNGEFYKADNRTEFDGVMREMEQIQTEIANLEVRLRPTGDLGMNWAKTTDGSMTPEAAEDRQLALAKQVDTDGSALVRRTINAFRTIGDILQGVLYGTVGGRYDSISNLGQLGGKNSREFSRNLESVHVKSKSVAEVLASLINVESLQHV